MSASTFATASAQTLSFGPAGAGGSGPWDNTTANWFNGSTAVPWASGGTAAFGGAAGTVTVNGTVAMEGATFITNGYNVTGGTLTLSGITPTITTNAGISAIVNSVITGPAALVKAGAGTLTIGNGANAYTGGTTVSQGGLVFGGNGALGSGTVTLGDANTGASNVSLLANFGNFFSPQKIANDIVVSGSGTGTASIGSTSFNPGSNGTIYTGTITLNRNATLISGNTDRTSFLGKITGTGDITIAGSRVTLDNSTNDFVGNVTISSGSILQTNAANVLPRTATVTILGNGVLRFVNTGDQTIDGLNGSSSAVITFLAGGRPNLTVGASNGSGNFAGSIGNVIASFTKLGAGTQTLSGANTYLGRTTISGGVLSTQLLANGGAASGIGASTSAAANLVLDGGTLQYTGIAASTNRRFTLTTNGGGLDASGSGALNFTDTTPITLSGTGSRTLILTGSSSTANTLAAILGDNGGPSSLVKTGSGRWVLTGSHSYTGSTTISAGTLALSGSGSIASASRVIADGTFDISGVTAASSSIKSLAGNGSATLGSKTLVITAANDTFSGGISGSGGLTISGGTQTLAGDSTYTGGTTISAGTLQLGNGGTSGSIVGDVVNNGALAFNRSDTLTFGGAVSGSGVMNQIGSGTTILTAVNPLTGPTNVNAGTLAVNGSLAGSAVTVRSGATLAGDGTVGPTTLLTGARIAPGNSIGTLTVNGAYAQAAGATYRVELDPTTTTSDLIRVNGTAALASGAGLAVVNSTGAPYVAGQRFTILTSTGLTGSYGFGDQVLTPFLNLRDAYDANNAYLTVIQTRTVGSIGTTPNQIEVGKSVDSLPAGNPIQSGMINQPTLDAARNALDQVSGEIHASARTALIDESWLLRNAVNDRLRSAFGSVGAQPMATLNYGFSADLAPSVHGPMPSLKPTDRFAVWGQGYGYWGKTDSDGNASKLTRSSSGLLLGADAAVFDNLRFGVIAGYSRSEFDVNARLSSGESDNYHLGLYGGGQWGALGLRLGASYTWHAIETRRAVTSAGFGSNLRADYDAGTAQVFGEVGYRVDLGQVALEPFAGLAYVNLHSDGFSETGGAAALTGQSDDTSLGYSTLGLRAAMTARLAGMDFSLRGTLGWRHAFGDVNPKAVLAFAGSNPFSIAGLPIARDAVLAEAGLDLVLGANATLGASYAGLLAEDAQDHVFKGVLAIRF
ncbi:autotransporter outer membrane beta-barrel domain-containing protein [Bosea sp. LjRoot237]|uniref:autotransporter outer membrane beta-barrel domain-containing protein n=1 Tax=Bosea sp. LjRoot237 TaxID=3342292 RepID=UPI003F50B24C